MSLLLLGPPGEAEGDACLDNQLHPAPEPISPPPGRPPASRLTSVSPSLCASRDHPPHPNPSNSPSRTGDLRGGCPVCHSGCAHHGHPDPAHAGSQPLSRDASLRLFRQNLAALHLAKKFPPSSPLQLSPQAPGSRNPGRRDWLDPGAPDSTVPWLHAEGVPVLLEAPAPHQQQWKARR